MNITRHRPAILTHISVLCSSDTQIDDSSAEEEEEYSCPVTPISQGRINSRITRETRYRRSQGVDAEESTTLPRTSINDSSIETQDSTTTMQASVTNSTSESVPHYRNAMRQYTLTSMQASGVDVSACNDRSHKVAATFSPSRSNLPKSQRSARTATKSKPSNDSYIIESGWNAATESAMTPLTDSTTNPQNTISAGTTAAFQSTPRYPHSSEGEWSNSYTATPEEMLRESIFVGRAAVEEVMRRLSMEQTAQSDSESDSEVDEGISMPTKPHVHGDIKIVISAEPLHPELSFDNRSMKRARGQSQGQDRVATAAADAVNRLDVGMRLKSEVDLRLLEELYDEELGTPSNTPAPGKGMLRANTVAATRGGKRLGRSVTAPLRSGVVAAECF